MKEFLQPLFCKVNFEFQCMLYIRVIGYLTYSNDITKLTQWFYGLYLSQILKNGTAKSQAFFKEIFIIFFEF